MMNINEYISHKEKTPGHFTFKRKGGEGKETDWYKIWSFLNDNGPADKKMIIRKLFNDRYPSRQGYNPLDGGNIRGWYSTLFRAATMCNVLKYDRNKKVWIAVPEKEWKNSPEDIERIFKARRYGRDPRKEINESKTPTIDDVRKKIPIDSLAKDTKDQTLFANILDWCRDEYNMPKLTFFDIARQLDMEYRMKHNK